MKHKILLLLFLFSLLPSWGWGQVFTYYLDYQFNGLTIDDEYIYTFTGTYNGIPNQNIGDDKNAVINVAKGSEITIILDNATIDLSQSNGCPLCAKDAKIVNLILKGKNTLIAGGECPGIWAPEGENCGIIIDEELGSSGSLIVKTPKNFNPCIGWGANQFENSYIDICGGTINAIASDGAGIGNSVNFNSLGGKINITGGKVAATSTSGVGIGGSNSKITITGGTIIANNESGAGIGGSNSKITITGGTVITNSESGAGIGDSKSNITITGGTVTATSESGAGIGSGKNSSDSNITITGGTVTAISESGAGIGDGKGSSGSTFSTGESGTAFINASSISDKSYKDNANGLIFDGNKGAIYGNTYTLAANATIEKGKRLIIKNGQILTINEDVTLTNNGKILLIGSGKIEGNGSVSPNKPVEGFEVTCNLNYDNSPDKYIEYVANGESVPDVKRDYYKFKGWFTQSENGDPVTTIKGATTVYAHWEPITLVEDAQQSITKTYGKDSDNEINFNSFFHNTNEVGGIKSIELISTNDNKFKDLSFEYSKPDDTSKGILRGIPINIGYIYISFKITAYNGATTNVSLICTVAEADLTIAPGEPITKVYDGNNTVTTPNALKLVGVYSDDDVHLDPYILKYDDANAGTKKKITLPKKYTLAGEKKDCYNLIIPPGFALTGTITQAPLTITPKSNQKLFEGEAPAYEVIGAVNNETPKFTGSLGVESGKVVINSLALTTEFAQNYSLSFTPDIPITIINKETVKSLVQLNGTTNANGAYIDEVTVTAPDGFEIALESSTLKSQLNYSNSFTWNQKGTYDLNYKLKRISDGEESKQFSMEITVVKSHYIPDNGGNDNNDSSIKKHNVDIPEVEGISVDKGFGEHWIENWGSFKFTITIEKGYRMLSLPVVKVNDSEIAFSSRTDTTFTYKIKYIRTPKDIKITGIVKDPATANNAIKASEENIKIVNGVAYITVAKPTVFTVVDMNGNTISTYKLAPGETPIYNLPRAKPIVFWFDKERAVKVIIK